MHELILDNRPAMTRRRSKVTLVEKSACPIHLTLNFHCKRQNLRMRYTTPPPPAVAALMAACVPNQSSSCESETATPFIVVPTPLDKRIDCQIVLKRDCSFRCPLRHKFSHHMHEPYQVPLRTN